MAERSHGPRRPGPTPPPDPAPAAEPTPAHGLELDDDPAFQRKNWIAQRAAWGLMAVVLALGGLGLFGDGPFDHEVSGTVGGPLWIEHPRYARLGSDATLRVFLGATGSADRRASLWVERKVLDALEVDTIAPEPERAEAGADRTLFVFARHDPARPAAVRFTVKAARLGRVQGRAGVPGGDVVPISMFVYP